MEAGQAATGRRAGRLESMKGVSNMINTPTATDWERRNAMEKTRRYREEKAQQPQPVIQVIAKARTAPATDAETQALPKIHTAAPVTLDTLDTTHPAVAAAVQKARDWAERKRNGHDEASLVLCGSNGCGKTHIATAIWWSIRYALEDGQLVRPVGKFFLSQDLVMALGNAPNEYGASEIVPVTDVIGFQPVDEEKRPIRTTGGSFYVPLVVIDDVGREQQIPYIGANADAQARERQMRLFRVIQYCYNYKISVIITSNLRLKALAELFGPASWSRLQEMAPRGFMLEMWERDGRPLPDWRAKAGGR
jgi:DNA replication protein DnaC